MSAPFSISVSSGPDRVRLGLTGEIDLAAVPALRAAVAGLLAEHRPAVDIDLSQVTFLDSSGIGELIHSQRQAAEQGTVLRVYGARGNVAAVLDLTGVADMLAGTPDPTGQA